MGIVTGIAVDTLTKKLGPLPIWVWAILIGGGAGAVLLLRSHNAPASDGQDSGSADTTGTPQDVADSSDPYANYLDTGGLYNGYGASDLGSYAGGGSTQPPYYAYPTAPQTVTAKIDPALAKQLAALRKAIAAANKRNRKKPPPRRRVGGKPVRQQPHTLFGNANAVHVGGNLPRRNVQQHFVA